jgi:hypothetical protein
MLESLKNIFSRFSNKTGGLIDDKLYNIITIDNLDDARLPNVIENIRNGKVNGYLIKNVIGQGDISKLLAFYSDLEKNDLVDREIAGSIPTSFLTKMYSRKINEDYFTSNQELNTLAERQTGINLEVFFTRLIAGFNGGKKTSVKKREGFKGSFSAFQFRSLRKGWANIHVHCENAHQIWAPELNEELGENKLQPNPIPYFLTLQKAEGGRIVLFDLKWKNGQSLEKKDNNDFWVVETNGKRIDCSEKGIARMYIDTEPGDMLIFDGGKIWHMVESVTSEHKRVTLGAFLNIKEDESVEIWA